MNLKNIGENVKNLRIKKRLTQAQVAEMADISTVHMSHIETGNVSMSIDLLINICHCLDTTPNEILMGEFNLDVNGTSSILDSVITRMTPDEKRLLVEFATLLQNMNINKE